MAFMLRERIEGKWIDCFVEVFGLCKMQSGDTVAILSETQSRQVLVDLSELAALRIGAKPFHVILPTPKQTFPIPIRSTGTCLAIEGSKPVINSLASTNMVIDCTVEGLLHSPETKEILAGGTRIMMISNEHPELLERTKPNPRLRERVRLGMDLLNRAKEMRVESAAGTDLTVRVAGAPARGAVGYVDEPGRMGYWPAGLCLCFPNPGTVNGRVVLAPGDVNLTFKRYLESPVTLVIENDYVTRIEGDGLDAELMRSYYAAWNDREAYATSHVGWGMNPLARWDSLTMYDRGDINGTELRAFAGNFLFSTGANEMAGRFTACHFDLPMKGCTVTLDNRAVVERGVLIEELR